MTDICHIDKHPAGTMAFETGRERVAAHSFVFVPVGLRTTASTVLHRRQNAFERCSSTDRTELLFRKVEQPSYILLICRQHVTCFIRRIVHEVRELSVTLRLQSPNYAPGELRVYLWPPRRPMIRNACERGDGN